jgi:Protein of unknown function (DUF1579)
MAGLKCWTRAALLLMVAAVPLSAQENAGQTATPQAKLEDTLVRYIAASQPGPDHRTFAPLEGSWSFQATVNQLDQASVMVNGTSENHFILGGRFLLCEAKSGEGLKSAEMMTLYGFDNRKRQYFGVGMSSLASYALQPWGNYDGVNRSFVLSGRERDETTGQTLAYRILVRIEDADHHSLQLFYDLPGRAPYKVIEALFTRMGTPAPPATTSEPPWSPRP